MAASVRLQWTQWNGSAFERDVRQAIADAYNEAAADGVTIAQRLAPRDTGFMANTIEQIDTATASDVRASWGNMTALYTLWVEMGSRGRPGKYFLRSSLEQVSRTLLQRLKGIL